MDYRTKKKAFLEESEWIMYPDPNIPAIVSEELWDRANAVYKRRSNEVKKRETSYHNKYPYSGKIICGTHGTTFHRQAFKTQEGQTEYWRCKTYRQRGKDGCKMPALRTREVDTVLADLFQKLIKNKDKIIQLVLDSIADTTLKIDNSTQIGRIEMQINQIQDKKDKLLELSMEGAITIKEFKERNNRFNSQISVFEKQLLALRQQEQQSKITEVDPALLEKALWEELNFTNGISSEVVVTILDHIVVLEGSDDKQIYLEIYLRRPGGKFCVSVFRQRQECERETLALRAGPLPCQNPTASCLVCAP